MARNTTPFLLNLNPSEVDEPDISNDEFLDSLAAIGVWLRVLSAYDSLERYASSDSTSTQRLAALSNIYLQLGAQLEDQAVSMVAFSVWSRNRNLVLADLFSRIFINRRSTKAKESEIEQIHRELSDGSSKRVSVDQRAFFREVSEMNDAKIVEFFLGYKWRRVPSVKLIPKRHDLVWRQLPGDLRRIASSYHVDNEVPRFTAAYNKLKHGPQLVVQNPIDRAKRFVVPSDITPKLARYRSLDKPCVRLLFSGARTGPELTDGSAVSVAPFLIDNEGAVNKLFFGTMVHQAIMFSVLVKMHTALYRKEHINLEYPDKGILQIIEAHGRQLAES